MTTTPKGAIARVRRASGLDYVAHGDRDQGLLQRVLRHIEFPHDVRRLRKRTVENGQVKYTRPFQAVDFLV